MVSVGKTYRRKLAKCTAIASVAALINIHVAAAEDVARTGDLSGNSDTYNGPTSQDLVVNFADRWHGNDRSAPEFSIAADGVARESFDEPAARVAKSSDQDERNQFDATNYDEQVSNAATVQPVIHDLGPQIHNQFGSELAVSSEEAGVVKCGRSPLGPEAVRSLVAATAKSQGIDETLAVAIAWAESDFDRSRNSPKGARGPMQLMPETARRFGVTDICDPAQNIAGGVRYLRLLLDQFKNPLLVAAAYNSGEQRIYEYGGVPPFAETVGYVAKVVNFQMGLPMPARGQRSPAGTSSTPARLITKDTGVIAVTKTAGFVGGVMHF
ncbi:lytic transglycosylase domain-containing protein [Rhizobium sp.]|uniref:lytic transglycosylase domain-containing protein n=1 Tax=Rhizobium sp. TaxID=391 RepID=UPI00289F6FCF